MDLVILLMKEREIGFTKRTVSSNKKKKTEKLQIVSSAIISLILSIVC